MWMYTIQTGIYDTQYNTLCPKVAYIFDLADLGTVRTIVTCIYMYRGKGNIYRVRVVYANSYSSRRNKTYGSPVGWLWIATQPYSSHRQSAIRLQMHCCLYELIFVAFVVLVPDTHSYKKVPVATYLTGVVLYSDTEKCRRLPSGTTRTAVKN